MIPPNDDPVAFRAFLFRVEQALQRPLPGAEAHQRMAPAPARAGQLGIEGKPCREAAVLALLQPGPTGPTVLLTLRPAYLAHHGGQVSFPGGRRESGETLREAALREAHEEVGLDPEAVRILGPLTPLYIPPSNFCVHPFVGVAGGGAPLRPCDAEVAAILSVRVSDLLDPASQGRAPRTIGGFRLQVPVFDVGGHEVWGATAMMLAELVQVLQGAR